MIYLGGQTNIDYDQSFLTEIIIMQQHCGGQNIVVFKNFLKPNGLVFYSIENLSKEFLFFLF